ncbi:hypothetical protein Tco_0152702 [Tanacetum coccineum]
MFSLSKYRRDPNITIEEYIRLEEEKARRNVKVYNWETATYGKIWYDDDVHDLRSVEIEFPAIVFDDAFTSKVSPQERRNDNDKVNMPSFPSPEPEVFYHRLGMDLLTFTKSNKPTRQLNHTYMAIMTE